MSNHSSNSNNMNDTATNTQQQQLVTAVSSSVSWWRMYQQYVQRNESMIYFYDETISRLLSVFVSTTSTNSSIRWREVLYGCLELHRVFVQVAMTSSSSSSSNHCNNNLQQQQQNYYGASVAVRNNNTNTNNESNSSSYWSCTNLRFVLTILQSLYPLSQEMVRTWTTITSSSVSSSSTTIATTVVVPYRQALVRRYIEWIRCGIRISILFRYWKRMLELHRNTIQNHKQQLLRDVTAIGTLADASSVSYSTCPHDPDHCDTLLGGVVVPVLPGLLLHGGSSYPNMNHNNYHYCMFHSDSNSTTSEQVALSYDDERRRIERNNYVGKRTGRRIASISSSINNSSNNTSVIRQPKQLNRRLEQLQNLFNATTTTSSSTTTTLQLARIICGELLYIIRPILQVESDVRILRAVSQQGTINRRRQQIHSWLLCLGVDVISLLCLNTEQNHQNHQQQHFYTNTATVNELQRRRMRLWLYLLRSPIWNLYVEGGIQRVSDIVYRLPLLGGFLRNYIYDYIYYWKYYRAEEG